MLLTTKSWFDFNKQTIAVEPENSFFKLLSFNIALSISKNACLRAFSYFPSVYFGCFTTNLCKFLPAYSAILAPVIR